MLTSSSSCTRSPLLSQMAATSSSLVFFSILDLLLVCGIAFSFLFLARKWDYGRINLLFTQYSRVSSHGNSEHPEKGHVSTNALAGTTIATHRPIINPPV
ncbi:unnamed protein product [Clonostachys solani]|uniref:Uncharacterized protein n=1 Tax=Clonostachys solani TaxID=160281 RepID=A0A9P0EL33_9HYPO|nr:unnamed protein product [Clonostachys solani]